MDFITRLPAVLYQTEMVDAILIIVDHFLKWSLFIPVSSMINAAELADLFYNKVELRFGPPNGIISDHGLIFTSKFWSKLCYLSYIKLRLSTAFHPQTNGQTEQVNQTLEHYLRCFIDEQQTN
jgi:transposase InsO family protein